jgi:hypothetical protein
MFDVALAQPDVHVERERVHLLARGGDLVHVRGNVVRREGLLGFDAKDAGPGAGLLLQRARQRGGYLSRKELAGLVRVVSDGFERTGLVLHLDHNHRVLVLINLGQVLHQADECPAIAIEVRLRVRREDPHGLAGGPDHARKLRGVLFDPGRSVIHHAVLPGAEPEQDELEPVPARAGEQRIHAGEVQAALLGLELVPIHGDLKGITVQ